MMMLSMPMVLCILFITKNMSSALILLAITGIMIFVVSPKFLHFVYIVLGGVAALVALIFSSGGFRLERFQVWLNPELYSQDGGYQVLQGLYAIGSGGLFGKGLGQSVQKKGFVPEAQNDMIFAIICEELGLVGAICVICMFIFLIWRLMIIASNAPDLFGSLLVVGIMAHISVQVVLNIAVVTAVVPNTGITLPFISYGGSSILFLLAEMGIALNISRQIKGT
jgi:cell division protein FtsW